MNLRLISILGVSLVTMFVFMSITNAHEPVAPVYGPQPSDEICQYYTPRLCSSCGFGSKVENCVKCGKWTGSTYYTPRLCSNCGFGNKKDNCVKCGKWTGSTYYTPRLCSNCGFGNKKENCIKCGKWAN